MRLVTGISPWRSALPILLALAACRPSPPPLPPPTPSPPPVATPAPDLVRAEPPEIVDDLSRESLVQAIARDLETAQRLGWPGCSVTELGRALGALGELAEQPTADLGAYLRDHFAFYRSTGRRGGSLFTGYYEPIVEGRRAPQGAFVHPLYRRPSDLIEIALGDFSAQLSGVTVWGRVSDGKLAPYYSRREIDSGHALDGRGLDLVWLDDPVTRYFLQVQGSGIVRLEDGSTLRVGFAGSNGKPYTSIGRLLAEAGALGGERPTAAAIQRYLRANPEKRDEILFRNERYVFFRETPAGPIGALGVTLTAGRSIAVDPAVYPLGALAYVEAEAPVLSADGQVTGSRRLRRLALAQDTGAAISGPGRVDVFFGSGEAAGLEAGAMSERGELYFLVPRSCTSAAPLAK